MGGFQEDNQTLQNFNDMMPALEIANKAEKLIVGLISGTSADGIDAALVRLKGAGLNVKIDVLAFATYAYPPEIRTRVLAASLPGAGSVDEICRLNVAVGECFAGAALQVVASLNLDTTQIDLIGSHGQTIRCGPDRVARADHPSFAEGRTDCRNADTGHLADRRAERNRQTHGHRDHCRFSSGRHGAGR